MHQNVTWATELREPYSSFVEVRVETEEREPQVGNETVGHMRSIYVVQMRIQLGALPYNDMGGV